MARYVILGNIGSDAGYWELVNGHLVHHGGWGVDSLREVQAGLAILKAATQLRTPGLADEIVGLVEKHLGAELAEHAGGAHTVVIG
jgi:hypothetical protein